MILNSWKENSEPPLQLLSAGYGFGSMLAPQLVMPFLDPKLSSGVIQTDYHSLCKGDNNLDNTTATTAQYSNNTSRFFIKATTATYPASFVTSYWILAGFGLFISAVFLYFYIYSRLTVDRMTACYNRKRAINWTNLRKSLLPRSCSPEKPFLAMLIMAAMFFYYAFGIPMSRVLAKFLFSYARDGPCFSVKESTLLETAYFAAYTSGRVFAFFISTILHTKYMIQVTSTLRVISHW